MTYYCVWWTKGGKTPEEQLMGIHTSREQAELNLASFEAVVETYEKAYIIEERLSEKGETLG